jgi:uncharacterized membrane protein YgdD (TMEM256/DUF423 family)
VQARPHVFRHVQQELFVLEYPGYSFFHFSYHETYRSMSRIFLTLGAVNAFLCVGLGAFGAHGLKQRLSVDMLAVYQTGVQYHFYHALGLVAVGLILLHYPTSKPVALSGWLMLTGIVLFSVSLYALSLTGVRGLGMITPFGGVAFLSAWAMLAYGVRAGVQPAK